MRNRLYIFGGYDGVQRLNDFYYFTLPNESGEFGTFGSEEFPRSSLLGDLRSWIGNPVFSDVLLVITDEATKAIRKVPAHKLLLSRCAYFAAMFSDLPLHEKTQQSGCEIQLGTMRFEVLIQMLTYLYTDECQITIDNVMEIFEQSDQLGIERLKQMCEQAILMNLDTDNAAGILLASDQHSADRLRKRTLDFIVQNFDTVSKSASFESLARSDVELVIEILKLR